VTTLKDIDDLCKKMWALEIKESIYKPSIFESMISIKRPSRFQRFKNRWSMRLHRIKKAWRVLRGNELD